MAAKALGLFLLLFWTSGLVKSIYLQEGWNEEIDHPLHISPHLRWRYMRLADRFPNLLNRNPNLRFMIPGPFDELDTKFDTSDFQKNRKEGFIPNVPNLNSAANSIIPYLSSSDESVSSSPVPNEVTGSEYPDFDWNAKKKGEYLYFTKDRPDNAIKSTTRSDSPAGSKSSVLYLEPKVKPRDYRPVTGTETSESGHSTSSIDDFSSANSQRTEETDEVITRSDLTLSPELNSLSTENPTVTGVDNATVELQNGTDNSSQNDSESYTTENTTGGEINSSADSYGNSSEDGNTVHTDNPSASTAEEITPSTEINTDSSVSYTSETPTAIQTGESAAPNTSYSTQGDEMQSTTNQVRTASEAESLATSNPPSSTDETNDVSFTTIGFTESELNSTTVIFTESEAISIIEGSTESEFISTTVGFTESEFISTTVGFTESEFSTKSGNEITESVSQDHVIKIKSIRTARVIVSVVFIVIVLVATVVLAIYTFRVKRRAVQYDQLMLLP